MMKDWRLHSILVVCLLFLVMLAKAAVVPASCCMLPEMEKG